MVLPQILLHNLSQLWLLEFRLVVQVGCRCWSWTAVLARKLLFRLWVLSLAFFPEVVRANIALDKLINQHNPVVMRFGFWLWPTSRLTEDFFFGLKTTSWTLTQLPEFVNKMLRRLLHVTCFGHELSNLLFLKNILRAGHLHWLLRSRRLLRLNYNVWVFNHEIVVLA